jgi:K+-transporting ATPase ATPase C chain
MWQQLLPGLRITVFFTVLCGLVYPLAITGICQLVFPHQANGSLIPLNGNLVGSELLAQGFTRPEYFQPRPSVAGNGYDPTASGGSNYGPTNKKLIDRVQASVEQFRKDNPDYHGAIPADLLTASASGLDPHLSPDSALAQAARVAKARGVAPDRINTLIASLTEGPDLTVLGEPRVNVLKLNLALDRQFPRR